MKATSRALTVLLLLFMSSALFAGMTIEVKHSKVYGTISKAIVQARPGDTVLVENGKYKDNIYVSIGVVLKAMTPRGAIINGRGHGTVVTMAANSVIDGFVITNGTIGVFSKVTSAEIKNCQISENWLSGIITVRHLPLIQDNLIVFNRGSGFVGWDVRTTEGNMIHNTIAYNATHGIFIGGKSKVKASFNTVAYNQRFGLKISDASNESVIESNNFWLNLRQDLPTNNFSFDPAFVSPRIDMDFRSDPTLCCTATDNGENLGARKLNAIQ